MFFREIDRSAPEGQEAMVLLAATASEALADAARRMDRMFLLGSPWAPGLWFVGGQIAGGADGTFSVGGGGVTFEAALASCAGEAVERTALIERAGDVAAANVGDAATGLSTAGAALAMDLLAQAGRDASAAVDWVTGFDPRTGEPALCPADWVLRRSPPGPLVVPGAALSTGTAAGPTRDAALTSAILELIERDAAALWWRGGRPARLLPLESPEMAAPARHLAILRRDSTVRTTRLFDITTDLGIPAVAAISTDGAHDAFSCGLGCRLTRAEAAISAVTELCQGEIGLQFATQKAAELGETALSAADRGHIDRARLVRLDRMPWYAAPILPDPRVPADGGVAWLVEHLHTHAVTMTVFNATREAVPVVKVIAPLLQPYPGSIETERLRHTRREFGEGIHWTNDVSLT